MTDIIADIGVFIGRFQPFHRGHLDALFQIERAMWNLDNPEIAIVVGGPREFNTDYRHFWNFEEVKSMILSSCHEIRIPIKVYHVPDVGNHDLYGKNVEAAVCGHGDRIFRIFSGSEDTLRCFKDMDSSLKVRLTLDGFFKHGTDLRLLILADFVGLDRSCNWARYVPRGTEEFLRFWTLRQRERLGLPCC